MSQPRSHTEIFETINEAYSSGDYDAAWAVIDPEIEWVEPPEMPGSQTYHGHEGVRESLTRFWGTWSDPMVEHHDFAEEGDHLLLRAHLVAKGKTSGAPAEMDEWQVWTFRNDKAVRMEMFLDETGARRAAGREAARGAPK